MIWTCIKIRIWQRFLRIQGRRGPIRFSLLLLRRIRTMGRCTARFLRALIARLWLIKACDSRVSLILPRIWLEIRIDNVKTKPTLEASHLESPRVLVPMSMSKRCHFGTVCILALEQNHSYQEIIYRRSMSHLRRITGTEEVSPINSTPGLMRFRTLWMVATKPLHRKRCCRQCTPARSSWTSWRPRSKTLKIPLKLPIARSLMEIWKMSCELGLTTNSKGETLQARPSAATRGRWYRDDMNRIGSAIKAHSKTMKQWAKLQ